ncbi:MAG: proline--tRNA ligase [Candidatus Nanoarchaeia archaeon]|nr:proline--tRNA ligase [Candidatus Nanoarchaeia archaeon]
MAKEFSQKKNENFSEWFTEIIKKAELADIRYNVKGFLVFQPWSVLCMEKMYHLYEKALQRKGHKPYFFPTVIPEKNFKLESEHVKGFSPEVFWVTHGGSKKLEEKLALRPTSETAFYQMFSLWIRSWKDLPFKTYQRANIFRYETKATRPFLRSREFYWIECHCAHASEKDAFNQVKEDMRTTKEVMHDLFGLPFMFFKRPQWDKFAGAVNTYAADVLNPDGKVVQQPSTHMLGTGFSKSFDVKFSDKDEKEKYCYITCYGPAISRIFASVMIVHADDKGLVFPWNIAPLHIIIVPIGNEKELVKKASLLKEKLQNTGFDVDIDLDDSRTPGEKFYSWELKGVPLRIELGKRELQNKELTLFRRDLNKKEKIKEAELIKYINNFSKNYDLNLIKKADKLFENSITDALTIKQIMEAMENGKIARCGFCSVDKKGEKCAEVVEKETGATVRGTLLEKEEPKGKFNKCVICGKPADEIVYIARQY